MVKWLVRVNASMAERISGISSNPAEDLAFAKICTKNEEKNICKLLLCLGLLL